jgi:hypothetical protein
MRPPTVSYHLLPERAPLGTKSIEFFFGGQICSFTSSRKPSAVARFVRYFAATDDQLLTSTGLGRPLGTLGFPEWPTTSAETPIPLLQTLRLGKKGHIGFGFLSFVSKKVQWRLARNQGEPPNRSRSDIFVGLPSACPMMNTSRSTIPEIEALLIDAAQGDVQAVRCLLEKRRGRLRKMIAARLDPRLAPRLDPSDVVQEALADAARTLPDYLRDRPLPFYPWLHRLAAERLARTHRLHIASAVRRIGREAGWQDQKYKGRPQRHPSSKRQEQEQTIGPHADWLNPAPIVGRIGQALHEG